ncbi:hypothetical protein SLEP1_g32448 [Rubroshorea leprosula]|uniref:Uncharacterized protein n=1 Tax=Rubroshorea leprosula TaxID=152421 RepID=A0AAV5KDC4_9ROSI|nr:hypothetical protein SLEP1_g32448 [Rubroshorea leprosula]
MTSFERIVTHPATATVAKEVIEQPNVNLESLKQVILNLFNAPTALSTGPGTKPWYFDSGCCNHMSSITAHFSSMLPNNSFPDIYSADGSPMNVSHIGNVSTKSLTLPNALLVPKLSYNLLSVGQLCDLGLEVTFSTHGCRVQDPRTGQLLGTGRKVGRLFELNYLHISDNKMDTPSFPNDRFIQTLLCAIELESLQIPYQQILQVCAATNISPIHLWHSRLEHTSVGKLHPLISRGLLGSVPNESVHCVSCQSAKQPALSFSSSHSHSTAPFDLVHSDYASDLVSKAELNDGKSVSTPLEPNVKLTPMDGSPLSDPTRYWQLVGSLVYLTTTRPDIAYAVHIVSQFMATPRSTHYAAILRIIRYVKGTLFHGLHFFANSSPVLRAYSNADWAGDPSDRRSTTGYCLFLGNSLISWRSKKQAIPSRSSTEAKYRALEDTTSELLSLRWLLEDMGIPQPSSTDLYCDNQSAMQIAHNDVFHERTKHIEVDCHFIRHHVAQGTVRLVFIGSTDQPADLFTKTHFLGRFRTLLSKLKLISSQPP